MSARRRNLSEFIPAAPEDPPALPGRPAPAEPGTGGAGRRQRPPRAGRPAKTPPAVQADRPTARALAAPARPSVAREALKVDVPADLALLQRLRRRRLDTGMDIRDQVAIAVDEWLTGEGY